MNRYSTIRWGIAAAAILTGILLVLYFQTGSGPPQQVLTDIETIEVLRTQFNLDAGKTRLILFSSPT